MGALDGRIVKKYKKYWEQKASQDRIAREKLRQQALKISKRLGEILISEFHAKKVVLFGRLMMESPFDVDLKPMEDISYLLKQRIAKGKVLYEKKSDS